MAGTGTKTKDGNNLFRDPNPFEERVALITRTRGREANGERPTTRGT
jgi:hypothetical protein